MSYKGYNISDAQSQLLYDILLKQEEIFGELKKLNEKAVIPVAATIPSVFEPVTVPLLSTTVSNIEKLEEANVQMTTKTIMPSDKPVKERIPTTRARRKTKAKSKKTAK